MSGRLRSPAIQMGLLENCAANANRFDGSGQVSCIFTVVVFRLKYTNDNEEVVDCFLNFNTYHFTVSVNWYFPSY